MVLWGVAFHSLLATRWNSLVPRYSLQNHSLLVVELACYSLQKLLVTKIHLLLVAEAARCQKILVTCWEICLLLVGEVARCKKSLGTRCKIRLLLFATNHLLLNAKNHSSLFKTIISPNSYVLLELRLSRL